MKTLIRLGGSESSLGAHHFVGFVVQLVLTRGGSDLPYFLTVCHWHTSLPSHFSTSRVSHI